MASLTQALLLSLLAFTVDCHFHHHGYHISRGDYQARRMYLPVIRDTAIPYENLFHPLRRLLKSPLGILNTDLFSLGPRILGVNRMGSRHIIRHHDIGFDPSEEWDSFDTSSFSDSESNESMSNSEYDDFKIDKRKDAVTTEKSVKHATKH